ncbi:MAG: hypothetical protein GKR95_15130 [Gammaproteobacteria bacterium]|nr:hypothetical protein [Gammaproteobacteria bacterium]
MEKWNYPEVYDHLILNKVDESSVTQAIVEFQHKVENKMVSHPNFPQLPITKLFFVGIVSKVC